MKGKGCATATVRGGRGVGEGKGEGRGEERREIGVRWEVACGGRDEPRSGGWRPRESWAAHGEEKEMMESFRDIPIDRSSVKKLRDQLYAGVFLNHKRKKYWVERTSYHNCFMLFARDLAITWADDERYWHWPSFKETSDAFVDVAQMLKGYVA
ncbi:hypothetical protein RJ639_028494 [Escallonia herrerae]|uniref:Uncharacterized protein n=1 Tax=Escallonia herrerae TaxID=1293975 RepID=A0AA89BEZ7_9ASTE|nr:hypothetical protein RJ639_028494 [Escallonia herrerae]